jgi:hypothetical protein
MPPYFFGVGYKGGKFYWLAIHSDQANQTSQADELMPP